MGFENEKYLLENIVVIIKRLKNIIIANIFSKHYSHSTIKSADISI